MLAYDDQGETSASHLCNRPGLAESMREHDIDFTA